MQSLLSAFEASISELNKLQPICSYLNDEVIGEYQLKFEEVKNNLLYGNSFLVNLTTSTPIDLELSLEEIFYNVWSHFQN